jgi:regulator of sigma E protease
VNLFAHMPTGVGAVFWGVVTFSILVVLHEGGHFLAARAFGVKVHEFMLGLPGPALRWRSKKSGVIYGITAVPLGGYVRIAGMEPGSEDELLARALGILVDAGSIGITDLAEKLGVDRDRASALLATLDDYGATEQMKDWPEDRSLVTREAGETDDALLARVRSTTYRGQKTWKRVTILAMGVIVNLLTAIVIWTLALSVLGLPEPSRALDAVPADGPAAKAGIVAGDIITRVNGHPTATWDQVLAAVEKARIGETVLVQVDRGGVAKTFTLVLASNPSVRGRAYLGVHIGTAYVQKSPIDALKMSIGFTGQVFAAIGRFFSPSTFSTSIQNARSIVGISYEVSAAAQEGPLQYLVLFGLLSLSLGAMNILPIPPLDGGKVAVELVERLIRRTIPRNVSLAVSGAGTLLLFSLIFYLMYADVVRYILKG